MFYFTNDSVSLSIWVYFFSSLSDDALSLSLVLISCEVFSVLLSSSLFDLLLRATSVPFQVRASRYRALVCDAAFRVDL